MKKWPFIACWSVLLAICLIVGVTTRSSFITVPGDASQLSGLQYEYSRDPSVAKALEVSAQTLTEEADCIVTGTFTGAREYRNRSFFSQFRIDRVLSGNPALRDVTIGVYEPVEYSCYMQYFYDRIPEMNPEHWEATQSKFHLDPSKTNYYLQTRMYGFSYGYTLMNSGESYVLLLKERELARGMAPTAQPEFVFIDSPCAKFNLEPSVALEQYDVPPLAISVEEASHYEIIFDRVDLYRQYVERKDQLFQICGLAE